MEIVDEILTPGCPNCAIKHLSAAIAYAAVDSMSDYDFPLWAVYEARARINAVEFLEGYTSHFELAVGFLELAEEAACEAGFPVNARVIRSKRIALMKAEFYDRMVEGASEFEALMKGVENLRYDITKGPLEISASASGPRSYTGSATVKTAVSVRKSAEALEVEFDCVEPKMDITSCAFPKKGDPEVWRDNNVEIMLNPNGDRKTVFHMILTSKGVLSVERYVSGSGLPPDWSKDFGVTVKASLTASGWKGRFTIPLASLGEMKDAFPVNFCRSRVLTDGTTEHIVWSSYVHNFHDIERFGTLVVGK